MARSAADWSQCYLSPAVDYDHDHLSDNCEYLVAAAFGPLLMMSETDGCPIHEPYFAARPVGQMMEIIYLLGYHYDCGTWGHAGDSEWVTIRVWNNNETKRWELISMTLSAHWNTGNDQTATYYNYEIWYPAQDGTSRNWGQSKKYPEVWVSRGKHANYRDQGECKYFFSGDNCDDNVPHTRVIVDHTRNIGSFNYKLKDCVFSVLGEVGYECFWTGSAFRGWQNLGGDTPYGDILDHYGWK